MKINIIKKFCILLTCLFSIVALYGQLTFSEVMFDPSTNEYYDEFIEVYNYSNTSVLLKSTVLDRPASLIINGSEKTLYSPDDNYLIKSGQRAVILDNGYLVEQKSNTYDEMIPDTVLLLTIEGASFGLGNDDGNELLLIHPVSNDTISAYTTTPDQKEGHSDEKILLEGENTEENWGNSLAQKGTPGLPNSITPRDYDLGIINAELVRPQRPLMGDDLFIELEIENKGLESASGAELLCGLDRDQDSTLQSDEIGFRKDISLEPGEIFSQEVSFENQNIHESIVIANISYPDDRNQTDNQKLVQIEIGYPDTCLVINEIMYDPDQGSDWIELHNKSSFTINLKNWKIFDAVGYKTIPDKDWFLSPKAHIAVVEDSSFLDIWEDDTQILSMGGKLPNFNNSGDEIIVRDHTNRTIDSLRYEGAWGGGDGRSLERRNPYDSSNSSSNWATSDAYQGATPGRQNSIMVQDQDAKIVRNSIKIAPDNIFKGDTVLITYTLQNVGLKPIEYLEMEARFHQVPDSLDSQSPISNKQYEKSLVPGETIKDSLKWELNTGGIGYLQLFLKAPTDRNKQNNQTIVQVMAGYPPKSVLINEIMFNPESGSTEWFEMKNVSDSKINLCDWFFKDSQNNLNYITRKIAFLEPGELIVVAEDMSFLEDYSAFIKLLIAPTFPALNNNSDSLALIDPAGNYIDSLFYTGEWGNDRGRSLERQSPEKPSDSGDNWYLSRADAGATPGEINSVAMQRYDLEIDSVWAQDTMLKALDTAKIRVRVRNAGIEQVSNYKVLINLYATDSTSQCIYQSEIEQNVPIVSENSKIVEFVVPEIPGGVHYYTASVINDRDQAVGNNSYSDDLKVGYEQSSLVINEVMYAPPSGEAEWIELYNTTAKPINLQNWTFSDATEKWSLISDSILTIAARNYVVLASNQEIYQSYPDFDGNIIFPLSFPLLNNTSETISIRDGIGHRVDKISYENSWGGGDGISIERKNPYIPARNKSNWSSSEDSSGATPGADNSILKFGYDLAIRDEGFEFSQQNVESDETVSFKIEIYNNGINASARSNIKLYEDSNHDGIPAQEEKVWELGNIPSLEPDSSRIVEGKIFSGEPGKAYFIIELETEKDYNPHNNSVYSYLNISYPKRSLVLNEFMPIPSGEQVEFVELYNRSENSISIESWSLKNSWAAWKIDSNYVIQQGDYLVLTADSMLYDYFGMENMNVIVSNDFPRLTNISDTLRLFDLAGKTIDSLYYNDSWELARAHSKEKYLPEYISADPNSWKNSIAEKGATPARFNSVSPLEYDLAIDSLSYPSKGDTNDVFPLSFVLSNEGRVRTGDAALVIKDTDDETIKNVEIPEIEPGKTREIEIEVGPFQRGYSNFTAQIQWYQDLNKNNDQKKFKLYVSYLPGELVISEFMAIPFTVYKEGHSISEYIEVYNFTNKEVDLVGWSLRDANTAEDHLIKSNYKIQSKDYFAIAADSSITNYPTIQKDNFCTLLDFPNLNNDEDEIYLIDPAGKVIDSLSYFSTWNLEKGIAQEKVFLENPNLSNNWRSSTAEKGGTPGYENSVRVQNLAKKPGFKAKPEAFTPDGDGKDDRIGFYYRLSFASANVTLIIYDLTGRIIAQPAYNIQSSSEGVIHWNGDSKYGGKARVGRYIARINAVDTDTKDKEGYITTFVIAKRSH